MVTFYEISGDGAFNLLFYRHYRDKAYFSILYNFQSCECICVSGIALT